jgi:trehalose 6-phosphate synthase
MSKLQLRFLLPLLATLVLAAWIAIPVLDRLTVRWFARDLGIRGALVADSLSDSIADGLAEPRRRRLQALFDRIVRDERLYAVALCDGSGRYIQRSGGFPRSVECTRLREIAARPDPILRLDGGSGACRRLQGGP